MLKKLFTGSIISLVMVWALVLVGVFLRTYKADTYPIDNNDDGLFYVWAGNSFLDNPFQVVSHSIFDADNPSLIWRSQFMDYIPIERFGMKIVRPWFDHPPLGTAIISIPARLLGYKNLESIPHLIVRLPALIASILTLFLTYLLGKRLFGEKIGRWGLAVLGTVPYFVIAHRQSFLENLITPLFLGVMVLGIDYIKTKKLKNLNLVIFLSFLSGWIKITGFIIPFLLGGWFYYKNQKKAGNKLVLTGCLSILSYIGYGWLADKKVFLATILNQGARGSFVNSFFDGLTRVEFYGAFGDGWYVLGLILALMLMINKKSMLFNWFFTGWLGVLFLTAGRMANSPWYRYPLIPFMAIAIGFYINKLLKKPSIFLMLPFWFLGLTGFDLINMDISSNLLRLITIVFFTPFVLGFVFKNKRIKKLNYYLIRVFVVGLIIINIVVNLKLSTAICSKKTCLLPQKIMLKIN